MEIKALIILGDINKGSFSESCIPYDIDINLLSSKYRGSVEYYIASELKKEKYWRIKDVKITN